MTMGHYLRAMDQLTRQFTPESYKDPKRQRLYLKDIDCPEAWAEHLKDVIPENFYYLNECVESRTGGDGAIREPNEYGQMRFGKGVAPAGDLMSSLPPEMRALNMMCYIGHEGTYTPAHREMCASLGHNIMVETSEASRGERQGSSIWFMTETKEREVVSEYFLSMLGHDIEVEKHFAQINAWKKAPFNVWVVEQKVGDLILIPPLAPHQVWNRGTRTMKAAWNRTTVDTLELAIHEALPRARLVCREEQYKNKAIIYYTLMKYHDLLQRDTVEPKMWRYGRIKQMLEDFKRLFALYTEVLISETFSPSRPKEKHVEFLPYDSNVTCSYCRCNIFNRFLTCKSCIETAETGEQDTYDVCMECYAMGRSCACISDLKWVEQWQESELLGNYEIWREVVVHYDGYFDEVTSPQPLEIARERFGKKPVAEICQEQLTLRPWRDITKPIVREITPGDSDVEPEADDEGRPKKPIKKRRPGRVKPDKKKTRSCHICCHHDWKWKLAQCTSCSNSYCYGTLWRAFDLMPQTVMQDKDWKCPKCLKICSCGRCRKDPNQTPYAPKGTLLGHDTKKVADFRSVESLVDFSKTNLGWLRDGVDVLPQETERMKRLKEKAEIDKAREDAINENYLDDVQNPSFAYEAESHFTNMADIDPSLREDGPSSSADQGQSNGYYQPYVNLANLEHEYRTPYPLYDSFDGSNELDGHHGFEETGNSGFGTPRDQTDYPSRLNAPIAPMVSVEQPYPEPSIAGPSRMMGIGYYQQESDAVDKILYDPLNAEPTAYDDPTVAPNNLIASLAQFESSSKKRKADDEDDLEFFTSKRQRMLAETRKQKKNTNPNPVEEVSASRPERPARQSVGKQQYIDLEDDAILFEPEPEPEPDTQASRNHSVMGSQGNETDDLELATKALNPQSPDPTSKPRRGRPRKSSLRTSMTISPGPPSTSSSAKPPRKSAWLARKEAAENEDGSSAEISLVKPRSKRTTVTERRNSGWTHINISSENNSEDEGTPAQRLPPRVRPRKQHSEDKLRVDLVDTSLNEEDPPIHAPEISAELAPKRGRGRPSKATMGKKLTISLLDGSSKEDDSFTEEKAYEVPPQKRRGRPSKATMENKSIIALHGSSSGKDGPFADMEEDTPAEVLPPRRRGRPSAVRTNVISISANGSSPNAEAPSQQSVSQRKGVLDIDALSSPRDSLFIDPPYVEVDDADSLYGANEQIHDDGNFVESPRDEVNNSIEISWSVSKDNPIVKVGLPVALPLIKQEPMAKKRRGRPPKNASANAQSIPNAPARQDSISYDTFRSAPSSPPDRTAVFAKQPKLLSLKEKFALKGKSVKIVAAKSRPSPTISSKTPSARERSERSFSAIEVPNYSPMATPNPTDSADATSLKAFSVTTQPAKSVFKASSIITPANQSYTATSYTLDSPMSKPSPSESQISRSVFRRSPVATSSASRSYHPESPPSEGPAEPEPEPPTNKASTVVRLDKPAKNGPTIVRLMSSELEEQEASPQVEEYDSSESAGWSSSDEGIPAVMPNKQMSLDANGAGRMNMSGDRQLMGMVARRGGGGIRGR